MSIVGFGFVLFYLTVLFFYRGAQLEATPAYSLLYWVRNYGDVHQYRVIYLIIVALILGIFIFVIVNHPTRVLLAFLTIWVPMQLFNNIVCHYSFVKDNSLDDTSILELRDFVLTHEDENFLLIDRADVRLDADSMWRGDTYLDTKNIIRYSPSLLLDASFPCDLNVFYKETRPEIDISNVKYIIICSELKPVDSDEFIEIREESNEWYTLYELRQEGALPIVNIAGE